VSDGRLVLADSPGTPDESRLMFNGVHCGKTGPAGLVRGQQTPGAGQPADRRRRAREPVAAARVASARVPAGDDVRHLCTVFGTGRETRYTVGPAVQRELVDWLLEN
jgi:hypothetical protein